MAEPTQSKPLAGKVALVTGASSGIGEAAARAIAGAGANVCVAARRAGRLEALVTQIEATGGTALPVSCDISVESDVQALVEAAGQHFGGIDILVNSAGMIDAGGLEKLTLEQWRRVLDVNLMGTIHACKFAVPLMRQAGAGDIVNISSTVGRRAAGLMGAYSTSKFGLTGFTEGLRQELGAGNIRVSIIEPGATRTEVDSGIGDPQWRESMKQHVNRDGVMEAADIADAIMFILTLPRRANVSQLLIRPTDDVAPM